MTEAKEISVRTKRKIWILILIISDTLMVGLSLRFGYYLRFENVILDFAPYSVPATALLFYTRLVYLFIPLMVVVFFFYKLYSWDHLLGGSGEYTRVITATTTGLFGVVLVSFMFKAPTIARGWLLIVWLTCCFLIIGARLCFRKIIYHQRKRGTFLSRALIVGANEEGKIIAEQAVRLPTSGLKIIGFVDDEWSQGEKILGDIPIVGRTESLSELIKKHNAETVIFASTAFSHRQIVKMLQALRGHAVDINLSSGLFEILLSRVMIKEVGGVPLVGIKSVSLSKTDLFLKTVFDFTVALLALILLSPLLILLALLIKITSGGPILYVQKRMGKDGRIFDFYKFRTMVQGADRRLEEVRPYNEADGAIFKMRNDPRLTPVGKFLRRFSFDELPQLFNVLKRDMSLVGPRPPIPQEVERYQDWHRKRLDVIPGMTGLWQVSGRSNLTFDEMVKLDLFYIENWSLAFDIKILLMTIKAVISGTGAY